MGERSAYDEIDALRERLKKLEVRGFTEQRRANRERAASLGLAVGAAVLFLSLGLPWLRGTSESRGFRLFEDGTVSMGESRNFATGWELWGEALVEGRWGLVLGFLVLAAAFMMAVWAVFALGGDEAAVGNGVLLGAQIAAVPGPVLFLVFWPRPVENALISAGAGVFAAVAACGLVLAAAQRAKDL
ncbi:hypothetical protein [Nocardiopsis protaetiae]|uniref:hypothetical protein n=1 Tax=Nocardiopsis protaetiae TaxID=3382270 RepID=UPI00387B091E